MRLTVIGCAPAYTRSGGPSSCYLLEAEGSAVVLDMGQGSFSALSARRAPHLLDGVLISHLHADHLVDLIPLRHYLTYEAHASVPLYAPPGLRARMDDFQAATDFLSALPGEPLRPGSFVLAGFEVAARHVTHIPDSFGFRVARRGGPGLVYSGDCSNADDLLPLLRRGDTLLCEAALGSDYEAPGALHLTARQAAAVAARSGVARLVLTHVLDAYPEHAVLASARAAFSGEVVLARPGLEVVL
jgi:ribonuclease BN (tRNA processing enzyme)